MKKKYSSITLYLLFFIYYELVCQILMFNKLPNLRFIYVILFSLVATLTLNLISKLFKEKTQKKLTFIFIFLITVFYIFNYLYFSLLTVPFSISTL
jgi:hypothetical protein